MGCSDVCFDGFFCPTDAPTGRHLAGGDTGINIENRFSVLCSLDKSELLSTICRFWTSSVSIKF